MNQCGIVVLDKPYGMSANRALQKVKRLMGVKKAGHAGTLDPMATGMLPICLGRTTKLCDYLLQSDKCYQAIVQLGVATATGDAEGDVIAQQLVPEINAAQIDAVKKDFLGAIQQTPPMYSALKVDGKRLYKLARAGETVERKSRQVDIKSLEVVQLASDVLSIDVVCSKGTYIRVLGEDVAKALGTCGHLTQLRRRYCAGLVEVDMVSLETLQTVTQPQGYIRPALSALPDWPQLSISNEQLLRLEQGKSVALDEAFTGSAALVLEGVLAAIATLENGLVVSRKLLG